MTAGIVLALVLAMHGNTGNWAETALIHGSSLADLYSMVARQDVLRAMLTESESKSSTTAATVAPTK